MANSSTKHQLELFEEAAEVMGVDMSDDTLDKIMD